MRWMIYAVCLLTAGLGNAKAWADIYSWVGDDGVRYITDQKPPAHADAEVFVRTETPPSGEADARAAADVEDQAALQRVQNDIRDYEARLARREKALERRIEEAEQEVQAALAQAEDQRQDAVDKADRYRDDALIIPYDIRPVGTRRHRYGHHRHPAGVHLKTPSLAGHPFPLGAIHLPLINAQDPFPTSPPSLQAGHE
jgi:hypothetical protein